MNVTFLLVRCYDRHMPFPLYFIVPLIPLQVDQQGICRRKVENSCSPSESKVQSLLQWQMKFYQITPQNNGQKGKLAPVFSFSFFTLIVVIILLASLVHPYLKIKKILSILSHPRITVWIFYYSKKNLKILWWVESIITRSNLTRGALYKLIREILKSDQVNIKLNSLKIQ